MEKWVNCNEIEFGSDGGKRPAAILCICLAVLFAQAIAIRYPTGGHRWTRELKTGPVQPCIP